MKKYIIWIFICIGVIFTSCKEYLDKAPEQGLSEEEIFTNADNFRLFFNAVYEGQFRYNNNNRELNMKPAYPLWFNYWDQKYTWEGMTDAADQGRYMEGHNFKTGSVIGFVDKFINDGNRRPILKSMFANIRITNIALDKIDMVKDISSDEKNDLIAQAHFVRAFCHFELFRIWGPMPYITKAIGAEDQWDIPRLSKYETLVKIAQDFDTAYTYFELAGKLRRDPGPGQPGHLQDPEQRTPTGVAAKAYKSRALLYAASPLNNEGGGEAWQKAATAAWEALQIALANQYELLTPASERSKNYYGAGYTNEHLWAWNAGSRAWNSGDFAGLYNGIFGNSKTSWSGVAPTQNFVDKYETAWGEPLVTEADRAAATAAGHYNEQDPFANRDPRLATDIITNQSPCTGWTGGKAQIYFDRSSGSTKYSELLDQSYLGISRTGYYLRKNWGNASTKNTIQTLHSDPLFRLAELYLNYAEASNEAWGPTAIQVSGADMSAEDAINEIRERMGQIDVLPQFTLDKEIFRDRIKNERNIELSWEGHYYHDIRRWMDAPAAYSSTLYGMIPEKVPVSAEFPTGFRYVREPLGADRQISWKPAMYYLPFNTTDNFKMRNFVPNEVW
jgi:starch-binding outer membrane protein, SusD/RagB family